MLVILGANERPWGILSLCKAELVFLAPELWYQAPLKHRGYLQSYITYGEAGEANKYPQNDKNDKSNDNNEAWDGLEDLKHTLLVI